KDRELDLIYTVIRKITFSMGRDEIQKRVSELVVDFFPIVRFFLIALFGENNNLHLKMKYGGEQSREAAVTDILPMPFPLDENVKWDEIVSTDEWSQYFEKVDLVDVQSSFIPLSFQDRELGFLMICKNQEEEYSKSEWRFLCTIANYVGSVLDNSYLFHIARTDPLTGLFTRRFLNHKLKRETEWAALSDSSIAVYMLDIDRFKVVNDTYGHPAGDQVLAALAGRLHAAQKEHEQVFRVGGEEMLVTSHGISREKAIERAEWIRALIADKPFTFTSGGENVSRTITISIGVAVCPEDSANPEELLSKADLALYASKSNGRNRVTAYSPEIDDLEAKHG
ncbi:MAG: sensor domain-containing diguanylate cyclase, partial [Victivallales bacterium]|nr:sensor domain-containing diguanylate cyclase [Victivallales bacterium]